MTLATFLMALGAAFGLGLLIGLERQFGQHPAGLRTNALVCAAPHCMSCWRDRSAEAPRRPAWRRRSSAASVFSAAA